MKLSRYFKRRFWSSFWVISFLFLAIFFIQNKRNIANWLERKYAIELGQKAEEVQIVLKNTLPLELIPIDNFGGELIYKPNFIIYYDETVHNARYTFHLLEGSATRGNASRSGIRFDDKEKIRSNTVLLIEILAELAMTEGTWFLRAIFSAAKLT